VTTSTLTTPAPPVTKPAPVQLPAFDHLSWSGIETYRQCPAKFRFRYIEQAPAEFTPSSLAFGSAFHRVFEHVQQARMEGLPVPSEGDLMDAFDLGWQETTKDNPPVKFNKAEDLNSLHDLATRMIASYRRFALDEPPGGCIVAIEESERFRILPDVPPIEMRLDLAEIRGDDLIVADLKTSKSVWNEQKARDNLPQLVLYAVGLMPLVRDLGVTRVIPRFIVVSKAKKPKVQIVQPKATQDDVQKLRHRVADVWAAVQAGVFVKHEGWQCSQCPYRDRCLGA
jgi:RecB family exonuclease